MRTRRGRSLLLGQSHWLAGGFLGLAAVACGLLATGTLGPVERSFPEPIWVGIAVFAVPPAVYAYWNDGLAACWLFVFLIVFGGQVAPEPSLVPRDVPRTPLSFHVLVSVFFASFTGPLGFVLGGGARRLVEVWGVGAVPPATDTVALERVLFGPDGRPTREALVLGPLGAGAAWAVVAILQPGIRPMGTALVLVLYAGMGLVTAGLAWRFDGVLPALWVTYLTLLGGFLALLGSQEGGVIDALWNALIPTLIAGIPGAVVGTLHSPGGVEADTSPSTDPTEIEGPRGGER